MEKENESPQEGITVAIRMRPLNKNEGDRHRIWKVLPKYNSITQTTNAGKPLSERITGRTFFTFDKVFGEDVNTTAVYENVAKGIISSVVTGLNGTIFAYGQTSSGKTYTMQGSGSIEEGAANSGGVVHMAAKDIFSQIESQPNRIFLVRASFLEIYNEEVRDLLSNSNQTLPIREDPRRGVFVQSQEEIVTDFESLLRILFRGEKSRAIASTGMNERSSRSHTIFRITIESRERDIDIDEENEDEDEASGSGAVRISTLNLVDLAGSESVRHTGATGDRQKEGGMINQSLLTLSRVIVALGQPNQQHVNFRDSKLTRILQPSLSGNARMAVICCATPSELYLEETRSTLQFASRAKLVKTNAQVNEVLDDRSIIRKLQRELAEAREQSKVPGSQELKELKSKAQSAGTAASEANAKLSRLKASILNAGFLFSNDVMKTFGASKVEQAKEGTTSRKRRQSDVVAPLKGLLSPQRLEKNASSPKTMPRKKKEKKSHPKLSPESEVSLMRSALNSKANAANKLKQLISEKTHLLLKKEELLDDMSTTAQQQAKEKKEGDCQINTLQNELAEARADLDATIAEYNTIIFEKEKELKSSACQLQNSSKREIELLEENNKLAEKLDMMTKKFDELQQEKGKVDADSAADKKSLEEMNAQLSELSTDRNAFKCQLDDAEAQKQELEKELTLVQSEKSKACIDVQRLTEEQASILEKNSTLEEKIEELTNEMSELSDEKSVLYESVCEIRKQLVEAQEETTSSKKELAVLESKVSSLEETLKTEKASKIEYQESLKEAKANLTIMKDELDASQKRCEQLAGLQDELHTAAQEKTKLASSVEALEQELCATKSIIKDHEERLTTSQRALEDATLEKQNAIRQLQETQNFAKQMEIAFAESQSSSKETSEQLLCSQERVKVLEELMNGLGTNNVSMKLIIDNMTKENDGIIAELEGLEEIIVEKDSQVETLEGELQEKIIQMNDLMATAENKFMAMENLLKDKEVKEGKLAEELKNCHHTILGLNDETTQLKTELSSMLEEHEQHLLHMEETQRENQSLFERLLGAESEGERLVEHLQAKESEEEGLRLQVQNLTSQLELKDCERKDLEEELSNYSNHVKTLQDSAESARSKLKQLETEYSECLQELRNKDMEVSAKQSEFVKVRTQLTSKEIEKSELHREIGSLNEKLQDRESTIKSLEESLLEISKAAENLNNENAILKRKVVDDGEHASKMIKDLEIQLSTRNAVDGKWEQDVVTLKESLEKSMHEKQQLESRFSELEAAEKELSSDNAKLQQRLLQLMAEKDEIDRFLAASEEELRSLKEGIEQRENQYEEVTRELQAENQDLHNESKQLREDHQSLLERVNQFDIEKIEIESKIMALEAEKMAALARMDSKEVLNYDQVEELEQKIKELNHDYEVLSNEKDELQQSLKAKSSIILQYEAQSAERQESDSQLAESLAEKETMISTLEKQLKDLSSDESELASKISTLEEAYDEQCKSVEKLEGSLANALSSQADLQQKYEEVDKKLHETSIELEQTKNSKANTLTILRERERERDEAMNAMIQIQEKNQELTRQLSSSLSSERARELEAELADLKRTKTELNQLLVSTNESEQRLREQTKSLENKLRMKERDLEDSRFRINQLEEELQQTELAFEEKLRDENHDDNQEHSTSLQELQGLRACLEKERMEREASEKALKAQMAEEQRLLVQEGEKMMESLRTRLFTLEKKLSESQDEAYASRQTLEKLRDEKKNVEKMYAASSSSATQWQTQAEDLQERISSLEKDLHRAKTDSFEAKEKCIESKEKLRKAMREVEKVSQDREVVESEISVLRRKISSLEKTNNDLTIESERLKLRMLDDDGSQDRLDTLAREVESYKNEVALKTAEVAKLRLELQNSTSTPRMRTRSSSKSSDEQLELKVEEMKAQMKQKDQRIKKLEAVRLTKEQVESIKKLKSDNMSFASKVSKLSAENETLKAELHSFRDSKLKTEVSALQFDKEALERKMRKLATHCQKLEGDRAGLADALVSCKIDPADFDNNLNDAVISLCDRLASIEDSGVSSGRRVDEELKMENAQLQSRLQSAESEERRLVSRLHLYETEVSKLKESIKRLAEDRDSSSGENSEASKKLRYLEQENLQLMLDVKTTKKQLNSAKEELEMLRMNNVETSTFDFGSVDLTSRTSTSSFGSGLSAKSKDKHLPKPSKQIDHTIEEEDKENSGNVANQSRRTRSNTVVGKARVMQNTAPGLGQTSVEGDDTAECKQS